MGFFNKKSKPLSQLTTAIRIMLMASPDQLIAQAREKLTNEKNAISVGIEDATDVITKATDERKAALEAIELSFKAATADAKQAITSGRAAIASIEGELTALQ